MSKYAVTDLPQHAQKRKATIVHDKVAHVSIRSWQLLVLSQSGKMALPRPLLASKIVILCQLDMRKQAPIQCDSSIMKGLHPL